MPFQAELHCVAPGYLTAVWAKCQGSIREAMRRGGLGLFAAVEHAVMSGESQLWIAWDGTSIAGACVTSLHDTDAGRVCIIDACGAGDFDRVSHLLAGIEDFARDEGCVAVRIFGRKGWTRVLRDYDVKRVVLEKRL